MSTRGFTLLETMIALAVLAAVGTAVLQVVAASARTTHEIAVWNDAVAAAENALAVESAGTPIPAVIAPLPAGFTRRVERRRRGPGLVEISVTVGMPDGRSFSVDKLVAEGP